MRLMSVLLLTGCGGSFDAPFPDETRLADLTGPEICELQEAMQSWRGGALLEDPCTFSAQFSAQAAASEGADYTAACELARDACIATSQECPGLTLSQGCSSTIAEYEQCIDDSAAVYAEATSNGCSPPDPSEPQATLTPPASCDAIASCVPM